MSRSRARPFRPSSAALLPWLSVLAMATLLACNEPLATTAPDSVARFAGREVAYDRFEEYLEQNLGGVDSALPSEVLSQLLDQFLDELLLAQLATERGLATPETPSRRAVMALLSAENARVEPGPESISTYYREHQGDFSRPERVRLAQILVEDRATAEEVLEALASGEDFAAVAERLSQAPGVESGGDQGELARGDLPPAFVEPIFSLSPGQTTPIVEADYGFHIFRVLEKRPAEELPLAAVEEEIREILRRQAADQRLSQLTREARNRYTPKVYERNVPFNYLGRYGNSTS